MNEGERDQWQLSHPFPTLRMKAMLIFWEGRDDLIEVDRRVARLLALMDPMGGSTEGIADPLPARFFFWGGLFIALADGELDEAEIERLQTMAPPGVDVRRLAAAGQLDGDECLANFVTAREDRRLKLSAVELHRIIQGLIDVAAADGRIDDSETEHLYRLAGTLGIRPAACDMLVSDYVQQNEGGD